jgi:Flp pilus assembly protein TadG
MRLRRRLAAAVGAERGAVLVTFALAAPVVVLFAAFALDAGNWFLHKRHLQVQADAAAFATAQEFAVEPCNKTAVYHRAGEYGGASFVSTPESEKEGPSVTPLFNEQVGNVPQSHIHELINSKRYYQQSSPVDATAVEKSPCETSMVDVKMTETEPPWFFKHVLGVTHINAHARIEILQELNASGVEPLAVAESAPTAAEAYFVNEDNNNAVIAKTPLKKIGTREGQDIWSNSESPLAVPLSKTNATTAHIGVVVALSGKATDTSCPTHPYVRCFDEGKTGPLLHIAGYSTAGTGSLTAPLARQVTLSNPAPNTCTDGYFSNSSTSCTVTISAKIDYGSTNRTGVTVKPEVGGVKGSALSYNAETGLWTGVASHSGEGSNEVSLVVECNNKIKESPCEKEKASTTATIKDVQRSYAAGEAGSGSISGAWISEVGGLAQDANSFPVCEGCTHKLVVTVNVGGSLADAQTYSDPLYRLRFGNSQAEVVGCEPGKEPSGTDYRENLAVGCQHTYTANISDPNCTSTTQPYDCVPLAGGIKEGPFKEGLLRRLKTEPPKGTKYYCANSWVNNNNSGVPLIPGDDSRVIQVFVVSYGDIIKGSHSNVPIQDFATFYVTGWDGDPCNSEKPTHPDDPAEKGEVVGHFVKYINTINNKEGTGPKCSLSSLGQCNVVLTR